MSKIKILLSTLSLAVFGFLLSASIAFGAADAEIVNAATNTATTIKENVVGSVQAAIPLLVAVAALIISFTIVVRMARRVAK